jgi:hypothetical protein
MYRTSAILAAVVIVLASAGQVQADLFTYTGSIQVYDVETTGTYAISASGAQGGAGTYAAGLGAVLSGDYVLNAGTQLEIVVGGQGSTLYDSGSGGGGTFVYLSGSS